MATLFNGKIAGCEHPDPQTTSLRMRFGDSKISTALQKKGIT